MTKYVLDKPVKKLWNLQQLRIGQTLAGIPKAEYWENRKGNKFIRLSLDYGHATCTIFFLVFDFPEQKILNSKFNNSFELVRFYREVTGEGIDEGIQQVHNVNWADIIDWLNQLQTLKIQVISKSMNGFNNLRFVSFTKNSLTDEVGFSKWIL